MSIVLKSISGYLGLLLLCLQRRLSQLSEGIEIISGILPVINLFLHLMQVYGEILSSSSTAISNTAVILGLHSALYLLHLKRPTELP